jgi:hypothetical protein
LCHEGIGVSATDGCVLIVFLIYCLPSAHPARSFKQPYGGSLRHRLSVRFWVQFRFQINITVKQVFVVLAYPLFFSVVLFCGGFVSFAISVKYFNDSSNSLGGAGGGGMTLSDVGSVCDSYVRLSGLCGSCVSLYRCCCLFRINFGWSF